MALNSKYQSHPKLSMTMATLALLLVASAVITLRQNASKSDHASSLKPWEDVLPTDLASDAVDATQSHNFPSLTYGIHASLWWSPDYRNYHLDLVNIMEFSHVRQSFSWTNIEPEKRDESLPTEERYFWQQADEMMRDIEAKNVGVVARIDHAPTWAVKASISPNEVPFDLERLVDFCGALATRYKGRINAYQIWNEPNLDREWGGHTPNPEAYVKLLVACSNAIRSIDPSAIIISAGISPTGTHSADVMPDEEYYWRLYAIKGFKEAFDVLGVHAPGWGHAPETDPQIVVANGGLRWQCFRHVEHIRAIMVANGDEERQIAITEMGWTVDQRADSTYSWFGVSLDQQADYLARAYAYAAENWRPWVGLISTLYLPDPAWTEDDEEYFWAIGTTAPPPWMMDARPAYAELVEMRKISTNPDYAHYARDDFGNRIVPEE